MHRAAWLISGDSSGRSSALRRRVSIQTWRPGSPGTAPHPYPGKPRARFGSGGRVVLPLPIEETGRRAVLVLRPQRPHNGAASSAPIHPLRISSPLQAGQLQRGDLVSP